MVARIHPAATRAAVLCISAVLPYVVFSLSAGAFEPRSVCLLLVLTVLLTFWYVVLPRGVAYDSAFLIVAATPLIARVFQRVYASPSEHLRVDILGHLMWIRTGLLALLLLREWDPGPVSFWPRRREWKIGALWFLAGVAPLVAVAIGVHDLHFAPMRAAWWRVVAVAAGTFVGVLWVVALGEELFFRGVIERGLLIRMGSRTGAVLLSSLIFGAAHLWFRHFPDWRRAVSVAVLGLMCGAAYVQAGSIRAPMVTHACAVVTWRILFS
ncbi:MAG: CPBP family intramembrane metalloprotease [Acidobacteriaceae bacterium]|nr:CPBP family intramembrane metalloprotease [Acidobacteriaceae bacterium]